jgi:hypothetical protein
MLMMTDFDCAIPGVMLFVKEAPLAKVVGP